MSKKLYTGAIVEESLVDDRMLNDLEIVSVSITKDENPADRWHIYMVRAGEDQLEKLSRNLKSEKWYAHFWDADRNIIAVFHEKIFQFNYDDKKSWGPAVQYGLSVGIPKEQLDFLIE